MWRWAGRGNLSSTVSFLWGIGPFMIWEEAKKAVNDWVPYVSYPGAGLRRMIRNRYGWCLILDEDLGSNVVFTFAELISPGRLLKLHVMCLHSRTVLN
jgi:hypothetical protein